VAKANVAKQLGFFPFAPVRLMRNFGYLNAATSIFAGRDMRTKFQGSGTRYTMEQRRAGNRGDVLAVWQNPGIPLGEKIGDTFSMWIDHSISAVTSSIGFQRTLAPAIVGEIAFQGAKAMKANKLIPPAARKFIRFT